MLGLEIPVVWLMCFMVRVMPSVMTQLLKRGEEGSRRCLGLSGSCRGVGWFQGHRDNLLGTVSYLSFRPRDRKGEIFGGLVGCADAILTESTELLGGRTVLHMHTPSILGEPSTSHSYRRRVRGIPFRWPRAESLCLAVICYDALLSGEIYFLFRHREYI